MSGTPAPPPLPWRIRTRAERLVLVSAAAAALVAGCVVLAHRSIPVPSALCVLKRATGLPCAGCGGTRALSALLGGSWAEAVAMNPGAVAAIVLGLLAACYAAAVLVFRLEPWRPHVPGGRWWRVALVAAVLGNWLYLLCVGRV